MTAIDSDRLVEYLRRMRDDAEQRKVSEEAQAERGSVMPAFFDGQVSAYDSMIDLVRQM